MQVLLLVLKGMAMGAANVVPGVSGGTIAFITGIYERFITALNKLDLVSLRLFFTGKWKTLANYIDLHFLFFIVLGVGTSIVSLAKLMVWALASHEVYTFAFFFGLIIASIIGVGKQVAHWSPGVFVALALGTLVAVSVAFLPPAVPNTSFVYLILCGAVAICSMVLPGLSGSYVLLLMGNYALIMAAIPALDFSILLPVCLGALIGLIFFSRLLSWLFATHKDVTIALLTGFVVGSLLIIWPWKITVVETILGKEKATGYQWLLPAIDAQFFLALALAATGFLLVWWMEKASTKVSA